MIMIMKIIKIVDRGEQIALRHFDNQRVYIQIRFEACSICATALSN